MYQNPEYVMKPPAQQDGRTPGIAALMVLLLGFLLYMTVLDGDGWQSNTDSLLLIAVLAVCFIVSIPLGRLRARRIAQKNFARFTEAQLRRMDMECGDLPYDRFRVELNQQALALAEELALPVYRTEVRYDLIWAYAVGDDAISAAMVAAHVATSLPQIPLPQYQSLMEQFHGQVRRYGRGERLWQMHETRFCILTGDIAGAEAHLNRFWDTPRDAISDCEACERSNAAEILLDLGQREQARQVLRPMFWNHRTGTEDGDRHGSEGKEHFISDILVQQGLEAGAHHGPRRLSIREGKGPHVRPTDHRT